MEEDVVIEETPFVMEETRYNFIKDFMKGRDVSMSYSDPEHNSSIDFREFEYVYNKEKEIIVPITDEPLPIAE